jgi:hypothetical protein
MFAALLLLQSSLLVAPLELGDKPPETVALAALRFTNAPHAGDSGFFEAKDLFDSLEPGADLAQAAATRRTLVHVPDGWSALLGTFSRAMLSRTATPFEVPIGTASPGTVSPPIQQGDSWVLMQRLERDAACRQIFVAGTDDRARAAADGILRALRAGADFAALARERSDDRASALRGGDFAIFERGPNDALLRAAAFDLKVGEISGVIASPLGFHILQRVEVSALDPRLRDDVWAHARGIVIAFGGAKGADVTLVREHDEAERIADDLAARIRRGEDMAALAKQFNDDGRGENSGRARAGDLGWVRRETTAMPQFMDRLFTDVPGTLIGPIASEAGYVLLRREDPGLRSRIDLRKSAFIDLERWSRGGSSERGDQWIAAATHAAQLIGDGFHWPLGNDSLDAILARCSSASDFTACCEQLPEIARGPRGKELTLRMLAREYAAELTKIEPRFRAEVWPRDEHAIDVALVPLRQQLAMFGDSALDEIMKDLDMHDPRVIVPVYLTTTASEPFVLIERDGRIAACLVDLDRWDAHDRLQLLLHWTAAALDVATREQPTVLSAVRERLKTPNRCRPIEVHALISAETANVVTRVFGPGLTAKMYFRGWMDASEGCDGGQASSEELTPDRGRRVSATMDTWNSHLAGKLTTAQALAAIVAAAKAAK